MTRPRRRKIPPVSQIEYMKSKPGDHSCNLKIQNTDQDRIMVVINQRCAYPDNEEAFGLVRALVRTGAVQWGEEWLDRVRNYLGQIHVVGGGK